MDFNLRRQATIESSVEFKGIGVHSGHDVTMTIKSAPENFGIVFLRTDISNKDPYIKLSPKSVVDPTLCTRIVNKDGVSVSVIEHLLAALRIVGITNAVVELNFEEVPIMDGSASIFVSEFKKSGIIQQDAFVPAIVIKKPVTAKSKNGKISITPHDSCVINVKISYDRINPVLGENNTLSFNLDDNLSDIANSRTFGWVEDCEKVKAMGLAQGSSLQNTVGISSDNSIVNPDGLRNPKELVMHKALDLIGDISVIGYDIIGKIEGFNTSHLLNNIIMRNLLNEIDQHDVIFNEPLNDFQMNFRYCSG